MEEAVESVAEPALSSTLSHLSSLAQNTTAALPSLIPSPKDLILLVPRVVQRGASLFTDHLPQRFENLFGGPLTGRVIASATGGERGGSLAAAAAAAGQTIAGSVTGGDAIGTGTTVMEGVLDASGNPVGGGFIQSFSFQQLRTFGGVFTYITSKWALGCFTAAVILNRTTIYASARRHLRLDWQWRLAVRLLPILMLLMLTRELTRTLHCQTSPSFPELRYGSPGKYTALDYSAEGGILYEISSALLLWESDEQSCRGVGMIPTEESKDEFPKGSLAMLWPSFQAFCTSQWVETLLCALQGRQPGTETGMSLFEHSLAFAEAEAMVSNQIGLNPFNSGASKNGSQKVVGEGGSIETTEATILVTKSFIVSRFNTPPEVLLMALISSLNNLSSQILGVLDLQAQYRLINTGFWGVGFMAAFFWGCLNFSVDQGVNAGIFRFPTVCVVGFIPHTLILIGIFICASIYSIALGLSVVSPPEGTPPGLSLRERFWIAHENMQANIPLSGLRVNWREDFYTSLLRIGFTALTAASEAVFLNEGRRINVGRWTWLEEERMEEIERLKQPQGMDIASEGVANGVVFAAEDDTTLLGETQWRSGYSREKNTKILKGGTSSTQANGGVGAGQRGGRYKLAFIFLSRIFWLITGWMALATIKLLESFGIRRCPSWLSSLLATPKPNSHPIVTKVLSKDQEIAFWMLTDEGELRSPRDRDVDVEDETRKREKLGQHNWGPQDEEKLSDILYQWWLNKGWWGEKDNSGTFEPPTTYGGLPEDDTTSLISSTETDMSLDEWNDEDNEDDESGRRTPTQSNPFSFPAPASRSRSRASTPFSNAPASHIDNPFLGEDITLDPSNLARLLNPQTREDRQEAQLLAASLSSSRTLTRSQYRNLAVANGTHIITSTRQRPPGFQSKSKNGKLTRKEEEELLEWMIVKYRAQKKGGGQTQAHASASDTLPDQGSSWAEGGDGLGSGGPQCVVCQSAARTILAWPCRCLSLCEECRVSLAMNNFATCVCCRQEVVGFSRLYVP